MHLFKTERSFDEIVGIKKDDPNKEEDQRKAVFISQQGKKKTETFFKAHIIIYWQRNYDYFLIRE
jgi:hypothetical protein